MTTTTNAGPPALWRNWGRSVAVTPRRIERPGSTADVQDILSRSPGDSVKAIGTGHSFSAIAEAAGVQLVMSGISGLVDVDRGSKQATFRAGTPLHQVGKLLQPYGLALENMGDIDRQTISGAFSTGTHGTGTTFRGLAGQLRAVLLVTADGQALPVSASDNPELWPAVRLGLGALGVVTELTVQCVDAFVLEATERREPLDEVLESFAERSADVDHFEYYWFPHTGAALTKTNIRRPADTPTRPLSLAGKWLDEELLANGLFSLTCRLGVRAPGLTPRVNRLAARLTGSRSFSGPSHDVFVSNRSVRFTEMEYAVPLGNVSEVVRRIRELIERKRWNISFPIEVRSAAADDILLSTAFGRSTGYVAVHRYFRERPDEYFQAVENIFREYGGRPHWGKLNYASTDYLAGVYPRFEDFLRVRDRLDPARRFGNRYLSRVLGD
ncbi:D-arabinono-1,4-lactone oxidase [Saxibacter everestensis]|uniref:D-arabinono-1,4-lactone oxidase n=1 Tax=Saxibacter everestensis TaxID=2909229 RepID=A0ABY8QTT9_9MICO|nr:D-arabinono-1,4-lactone oxidase [Brevibacteriaceae bacterium ZFBP1038]